MIQLGIPPSKKEEVEMIEGNRAYMIAWWIPKK